MTALQTTKPKGIAQVKMGDGAYNLVHRESTHKNPNTGPSHHFDVMHTSQEKPVGTATVHEDSTGGYGGGHVQMTHPDHMKDSVASKIGNAMKEHVFPKEAKGDVIDVEAKPVKKTMERLDDLIKAVEVLSKPPVSEQQRKAMFAAANGKSTLGIPKSVGKEFADADTGGKLPKKKDKAEKGEDCMKEDKEKTAKAAAPGATLDYSKINKPKKAPSEADAPTINYSASGGIKRTPGSQAVEAGFKVPKESQAPLKSSAFHTKLRDQRVASGVKKCDAELDELMSKADKDELFPESPMKAIAVEWHPDKESAANTILYTVTRLAEIKSQSWNAQERGEDVKKAFEYLYDKEKEKLKEAISCYKKAKERKPLAKSEEAGRLTPEALTKSIRERHSDEQITTLIKHAVDTGVLHRNILLEWSNYRTINPQIIGLIDGE